MSDAKKVIVNNTPAIVRLGGYFVGNASNVYLADDGNFYTSTNVEGALAEIGTQLGGNMNQLAPVINQQADPPISPTTGDRYLVSAPATGAWVGQEDNIAEWNGATWDFTAPNENDTVYVTATLTTLRYNGTAWVEFPGEAVLSGGNTTGPGGLRIGTIDNRIIRVIVGGIERALFYTNGNVGIGSDPSVAPSERLYVEGAVNAKQVVSPYYILPFATPVVNWDLRLGQVASLTLAGSTQLNITSTKQASLITLEIIQDGAGGHTLTFNSSDFGGVADVVINTGANERTYLTFVLSNDGVYYPNNYSSGFTGTAGSIPFAGSNGALTEDNANLYYEPIQGFVGIGTNSPSALITLRQNTATDKYLSGLTEVGVERWSIADEGLATFGAANGGTSPSLKIGGGAARQQFGSSGDGYANFLATANAFVFQNQSKVWSFRTSATYGYPSGPTATRESFWIDATNGGALGRTVIGTNTNGAEDLIVQTSGIGSFVKIDSNWVELTNRTAPTAGTADAVKMYSKDLSAGNTMLGIRTEGGGSLGTGTPTANRTVAIEYDGVTLYFLASTSPT